MRRTPTQVVTTFLIAVEKLATDTGVRYRRFSPAEAAAQFKTMVKALHAAGIEVILDVVYNHTAEVRPAPCSPPARARRWPTPLLITPCFFAL